jgi:succinate dehydrogenase / fumarate reductase, flavoprotein subunit
MIELNSAIPQGPIEEKWDSHKFNMKLVAPHNRRRFEVIVVGTGLAGAAAAATLGWHQRRQELPG